MYSLSIAEFMPCVWVYEKVVGRQACGPKAGMPRGRRRRASLLHPEAPRRHAVVADALKRVPTHVRRLLANKGFIHPLRVRLLTASAYPSTLCGEQAHL